MPRCFCPKCVYDLRGSTGDRCPECGADVSPQAIKRALGRAAWSPMELVLRLTMLPVLFGFLPQLAIFVIARANRAPSSWIETPSISFFLLGVALIVGGGLTNAVMLAQRLATVQRIQHGQEHTARLVIGATLGFWCIQLLLGAAALGTGCGLVVR